MLPLRLLPAACTLSVLWTAGCGECEIYNDRAQTTGTAFRAADPATTFNLSYTYTDALTQGFTDAAEVRDFDLMVFCIAGADDPSAVADLGFVLDPREPIGTVQQGDNVLSGCGLETINRASYPPPFEVRAFITFNAAEMTFDTIEATLLSKKPPEVKVLLLGSDESGERWQFDVLVETDRVGNAPTCN